MTAEFPPFDSFYRNNRGIARVSVSRRWLVAIHRLAQILDAHCTTFIVTSEM
jgi:hypothetical protein